MHPYVQSIVFAILTLVALWILIRSLRYTLIGVIQLEQAKVDARFTYVTAAIGWAYVSLGAPIVHLYRMRRRRVQTTVKPMGWRRLFILRWPWHTRTSESIKHVLLLIDKALRHYKGEEVKWQVLEKLEVEDHGTIKLLVEERLGTTESGEVEEESAWLVLFCSLLIASAISWAGRFATLEILSENLSEDYEIGKVLSEWLANYILVLAGFLQLISGSSWTQAIRGRCKGPLNTIPRAEREALVALYLVLVEDKVRGLKQDGYYGKGWQNGRYWKAPRVSTAVLALLGERFVVGKHGDDPYVNWDVPENSFPDSFQVRMIGSE